MRFVGQLFRTVALAITGHLSNTVVAPVTTYDASNMTMPTSPLEVMADQLGQLPTFALRSVQGNVAALQVKHGGDARQLYLVADGDVLNFLVVCNNRFPQGAIPVAVLQAVHENGCPAPECEYGVQNDGKESSFIVRGCGSVSSLTLERAAYQIGRITKCAILCDELVRAMGYA